MSPQRRRRRASLWRKQDGLCHYCREPMMHWNDPHAGSARNGGYQPGRLATIEHLRDRFDPSRLIPARGEQRLVLACRDCNNERGQERCRQQPIEELRRRSQRHGAGA